MSFEPKHISRLEKGDRVRWGGISNPHSLYVMRNGVCVGMIEYVELPDKRVSDYESWCDADRPYEET